MIWETIANPCWWSQQSQIDFSECLVNKGSHLNSKCKRESPLQNRLEAKAFWSPQEHFQKLVKKLQLKWQVNQVPKQLNLTRVQSPNHHQNQRLEYWDSHLRKWINNWTFHLNHLQVFLRKTVNQILNNKAIRNYILDKVNNILISILRTYQLIMLRLKGRNTLMTVAIGHINIWLREEPKILLLLVKNKLVMLEVGIKCLIVNIKDQTSIVCQSNRKRASIAITKVELHKTPERLLLCKLDPAIHITRVQICMDLEPLNIINLSIKFRVKCNNLI